MQGLESTIDIAGWIDEETKHYDVVASWENLCNYYDALRFTDQLSDEERLEEHKWIIQQMNSFLTKTRQKLMSCRNAEAMVEVLGQSFTPARMDLSSRRSVIYQKLRQRWVEVEINRLRTMMTQQMEEEGE